MDQAEAVFGLAKACNEQDGGFAAEGLDDSKVREGRPIIQLQYHIFFEVRIVPEAFFNTYKYILDLSCPIFIFMQGSLSLRELSHSMFMSRHVMSCHLMSCHAMSCHVLSCHVLSRHGTD